MTSADSRAGKRPLETEDLAIRFVNTAAWRLRNPVEERLASPQALLSWLEQNRIGGAEGLGALTLRWRRQPEVGRAALKDAIALREAIHTVLVSRIKGAEPPEDAMLCVNRWLGRSGPGPEIVSDSGELVWRLAGEQTDATQLLMPVACSAAELMTGIRAGKVRQCQDERGCGWLFVDESRAQNRRWCSMGDCGNRAKAHRHYERVRGQAAAG